MSTHWEEIGFGLSVVGIILTLWQVYELREAFFFEKMRGAFFDICTKSEIAAIHLEEIYQSLAHYYQKKIQSHSDLLLINLDYLNHCFAEISKIQFTKPAASYLFPLVSKNNYLLSKNSDLKIIYGSYSPEKNEDSNTLDGASKQFLKKLGIGNLSSFISKGKTIWDQSTFDFIRSDYDKNILKLHFIKGSYFKYVDRNELLSRETFFHFQMKNNKINDVIFPFTLRLPKENAARSFVYDEDFFDFSKRATTIGFHIFVVMHKGDGTFCTFVQKRGGKQVEYPNFYHVAPAGTFQPLSEYDLEIEKIQCNFAFTVLREFLEEVFNMEKIDRYKGIDPFKIFSTEAAKGFCPGGFLVENTDIKFLPMESKNYQIIPTGFFVDLMTLKPQLSFIFIIKNGELYKKAADYFQGNWEGDIKEYDLDKSDFNLFIERNLHVKSIPPAGAVAFAEGIHYYYKHWDELRNLGF